MFIREHVLLPLLEFLTGMRETWKRFTIQKNIHITKSNLKARGVKLKASKHTHPTTITPLPPHISNRI